MTNLESFAAAALRSRGQRVVAAQEQVARLDLASRWIEFIVSVMEAEARQDAARSLVIRMMPGIQSADTERGEGVHDHSFRGFAGKAAPPECDAQLEAELVDALRRFVRLKPAAADVLPGFYQEDGPVLNPVPLVVIDLPFQTPAHLLRGQWTAGQSGYFSVAPQLERQWQVRMRPDTESEARRP